MGFDRIVLPPDRNRPERPPWTSWVVLVVFTVILLGGTIYFLWLR